MTKISLIVNPGPIATTNRSASKAEEVRKAVQAKINRVSKKPVSGAPKDGIVSNKPVSGAPKDGIKDPKAK